MQHLLRSDCTPAHEAWVKQNVLIQRAQRRRNDEQQDERMEGNSESDQADGHSARSKDEHSNQSSSEENIWEEPRQEEQGGEDNTQGEDDSEDEDEDEDDSEGESDYEGSKMSDSDSDSGSEDNGSDDENMDTVESNPTPPVSPIQAHPPSDPIVQDEAEEQVNLEEAIDEHGNRIYIEHYPIASAGAPIRKATPEEVNQDKYPKVGKLKKRSFFEIVKVLMESGISGNFRNKYLRLKRVSVICFQYCHRHNTPHIAKEDDALEE